MTRRHRTALSPIAVTATLGGVLALIPPAHAELSAEELAKLAQNPVANLISLPFQYDANLNYGPLKETQIFSTSSRSSHSLGEATGERAGGRRLQRGQVRLRAELADPSAGAGHVPEINWHW